jgi:hypothetical protein
MGELAKGGRRGEDEVADEDRDGDWDVEKREVSPWRSKREKVKKTGQTLRRQSSSCRCL